MAGLAVLAKEAGHDVSGSDQDVYPPMSTQLESLGIKLMSGYDPSHIDADIECVIVGNVIRRGNPAIESVLDRNLPFVSGPEWLADHVLKNRWVLAVSGTHGKTTTTSMLAWILEQAGLSPGFLIGGVPENFGVSAKLGKSPFFFIEADEYDSAFFDKRSKFIHYRPKTLILNNLEFDHADIFPDLEAIKQQFHFLIRTIPGNGRIVRNGGDENLLDVISKGCWTPNVTFGGEKCDWQATLLHPDGHEFDVYYQGEHAASVQWGLVGMHNVENALAAMAAAHHAGVSPKIAADALSSFKNVKRRLEIKGEVNGIVLYDDFAHHPTAIATTLAGLRAKVGSARIIVVLEFGSYTMRSGVHQHAIQQSLKEADVVMCKKPAADWDLSSILSGFSQEAASFDDVTLFVKNLVPTLKSGDHVVVMSNSSFGGIHQKILHALQGQSCAMTK